MGLWPIAIFAGMLPVTLAGMGTRDGAFVYALRTTDTTGALREESVLVATLGYSLVTTFTVAAIGIPFALSLARGFRSSRSEGASHG
jgi:ABC-type spermidine/putrescine transport system permease subunit I